MPGWQGWPVCCRAGGAAARSCRSRPLPPIPAENTGRRRLQQAGRTLAGSLVGAPTRPAGPGIMRLPGNITLIKQEVPAWAQQHPVYQSAMRGARLLGDEGLKLTPAQALFCSSSARTRSQTRAPAPQLPRSATPSSPGCRVHRAGAAPCCAAHAVAALPGCRALPARSRQHSTQTHCAAGAHPQATTTWIRGPTPA